MWIHSAVTPTEEKYYVLNPITKHHLSISVLIPLGESDLIVAHIKDSHDI